MIWTILPVKQTRKNLYTLKIQLLGGFVVNINKPSNNIFQPSPLQTEDERLHLSEHTLFNKKDYLDSLFANKKKKLTKRKRYFFNKTNVEEPIVKKTTRSDLEGFDPNHRICLPNLDKLLPTIIYGYENNSSLIEKSTENLVKSSKPVKFRKSYRRFLKEKLKKPIIRTTSDSPDNVEFDSDYEKEDEISNKDEVYDSSDQMTDEDNEWDEHQQYLEAYGIEDAEMLIQLPNSEKPKLLLLEKAIKVLPQRPIKLLEKKHIFKTKTTTPYHKPQVIGTNTIHKGFFTKTMSLRKKTQTEVYKRKEV